MARPRTDVGTFGRLVEVWLAGLDLTGRLAVSTPGLYEREMLQLVMPAFEHLLLREITVRKVDQFIKALAANKSYSMAKQARTLGELLDAVHASLLDERLVLHHPVDECAHERLGWLEVNSSAPKRSFSRSMTSWRATILGSFFSADPASVMPFSPTRSPRPRSV